MTFVGTNVEMIGGRAKVTGAVSYVADMVFPASFTPKALRSRYSHAKLVRIDASRVAALSGVRAVVTRDDLAGLNPYFGTGVEDQPVVVIDKSAVSATSSPRSPPTAGRSPRKRSILSKSSMKNCRQ